MTFVPNLHTCLPMCLFILAHFSGAMPVWAATGAQSAETSVYMPAGQQGQVLGQTPESAQVSTKTEPATSGDDDKKAAENKKEQDAQRFFEESLQNMMPLDQEQIKEYRKRSDQRDRALLPMPAALNSRTVRVALEPGQPPVKVLTTSNIATSLVFHDSTGQPWPITSVTNGGPSFFQILKPELPDGNLLNIMPLQAYGASNIVVTLAKRDMPLVIRLEADSTRSTERRADAMVLFQLAHHGPNAQTPITKNIRETTSSAMLAFLDRVPPAEAIRMRTEPKDDKVEIWKLDNTHYIRTSHTLMWPAWLSVVNGAGDVRCYETPVTPRILLSRQGAIQTLTVSGATK